MLEPSSSRGQKMVFLGGANTWNSAFGIRIIWYSPNTKYCSRSRRTQKSLFHQAQKESENIESPAGFELASTACKSDALTTLTQWYPLGYGRLTVLYLTAFSSTWGNKNEKKWCPSQGSNSVVIRALESPFFGIRSSFERTTNDSRIFWRFVLSNIRRTNTRISGEYSHYWTDLQWYSSIRSSE